MEKPGLGWSLNLTLHFMMRKQVHGDCSPRGSAFPSGSGSQIQAGLSSHAAPAPPVSLTSSARAINKWVRITVQLGLCVRKGLLQSRGVAGEPMPLSSGC